MKFAVDPLALLLALLFAALFIFLVRKRQQQPHLLFSAMHALKPSTSWRQRYFYLPRLLFNLALGLFLLAFIDPHLQVKNSSNPEVVLPTEGIAIYLLLDQS